MGAIGANRFLPPWMQRNLRSYSYVNIIGKPNTSRWYEGFIPSGKFGAGYTGGAYLGYGVTNTVDPFGLHKPKYKYPSKQSLKMPFMSYRRNYGRFRRYRRYGRRYGGYRRRSYYRRRYY